MSEAYLTWLQEYCEKLEVEILAYCLMTNHVHLVAVPATDDGLQRVLKPLHMRYAQRINCTEGWKGHLWQGRFFSSPLDEAYLWAVVRYVERNPVRVGMVPRAEDYPLVKRRSALRQPFRWPAESEVWLGQAVYGDGELVGLAF